MFVSKVQIAKIDPSSFLTISVPLGTHIQARSPPDMKQFSCTKISRFIPIYTIICAFAYRQK